MPTRPSEKEEEYFLKNEIARLKKLREEHQKNSTKAERQKLKELHYLHCAKCGQKMETEDFGSIEIEVCPDCGGIYLDAGELGKLIEQSKNTPFMDALKLARKLWNKN